MLLIDESLPMCRLTLNGAATCRRCHAEHGQPQAPERWAAAMADAAMPHLAQGEAAHAAVLHAQPQTKALRAAAMRDDD